MAQRTYVIEFNFPDGTVYAGIDRGAWAFAPRLDTARLFSTADQARRVLDHGYGVEIRRWGRVVFVATSPDAQASR